MPAESTFELATLFFPTSFLDADTSDFPVVVWAYGAWDACDDEEDVPVLIHLASHGFLSVCPWQGLSDFKGTTKPPSCRQGRPPLFLPHEKPFIFYYFFCFFCWISLHVFIESQPCREKRKTLEVGTAHVLAHKSAPHTGAESRDPRPVSYKLPLENKTQVESMSGFIDSRN